MSFSNILSQSDSGPPKIPPPQPQTIVTITKPLASPRMVEARHADLDTSGTTARFDDYTRAELRHTDAEHTTSRTIDDTKLPTIHHGHAAVPHHSTNDAASENTIRVASGRQNMTPSVETGKEYQAAMARLEEALLDVDDLDHGYESAFEEYKRRSGKRARDLEDGEKARRKVHY